MGNTVNPLEAADQYGTDALRFNLVTGSTPGNDMKFSESRLEGMQHFANKLWNATRFIVFDAATGGSAGRAGRRRAAPDVAAAPSAARWPTAGSWLASTRWPPTCSG